MTKVFEAESVAVVGASKDPSKAGHQVLKTLLSDGYRGEIYAVNPRESSVLGVRCFPSLLDVPSPIRLLIVSLPALAVPQVLEEAERRSDVRGAVILSAGFSETGIPERVEAERKLAEIARRSGIRIFGPNCIGIINPTNRLCTGFAPGIELVTGNIGYISQSGAFGAALLMLAADQPVPLGFAKFGHLGNMCDVSIAELLRLFGDDPNIELIVVYLEGLRDGREFIKVSSTISSKKPILLLKAGRTDMGARAAQSHTGALAGIDPIFAGAFKQSGVIRVETIRDLMDGAKALSMLPKPKGNRVCVLTEAGGPGILCMDEVCSRGILEPARLGTATIQSLKSLLPPMAMINRPEGYVDMTAAALEKEHAESLRHILADSNVDAVIVISVPPTFLSSLDLARALGPVIKAAPKPVLVCLMKGKPMVEARAYLEENGIPTFDTPDGSAKALEILMRGTFNRSYKIKPLPKGRTHPLIGSAKKEGRHLLEPEALQLLKDNGIPVLPSMMAKNKKEAQSAARALGRPVVLKIISPQVLHKSDVGGVKLGLRSQADVGRAYEEILANVEAARPDTDIRGVLVVPAAEPGPEIIIGMMKDKQFGAVIMFGCGGVFVEVFRDVSFRLAPFGLDVALDMIKETKAFEVLRGSRGQKPADLRALAGVLAKVSYIGAAYQDIAAIDLNPVRVYQKGFAILDARILLGDSVIMPSPW